MSTKAQRTDRQISGLKDICDRLYVEKLSAVSAKRPIFEEVLSMLQRGDTFVVWDLDRAFRSTKDAIIHEERFRARGIKFQAMNMVIETDTADGNYNYQTAAAACQRERKKISERTIEGLKEARLRGSVLGRRPKMSDRQILSAKLKLEAKEISVAELAAMHGVAPWTLTRSINRLVAKTKSITDKANSPLKVPTDCFAESVL